MAEIYVSLNDAAELEGMGKKQHRNSQQHQSRQLYRSSRQHQHRQLHQSRRLLQHRMQVFRIRLLRRVIPLKSVQAQARSIR